MLTNILIFSPHPDDAELIIGGFIILHSNKYKIRIINLTCGEHSCNGNRNLRINEANFLMCKYENIKSEFLFLGDACIDHKSIEQENEIIKTIRIYRPSIIFTTYYNDEHPDHVETYWLVKNAIYKSGLNVSSNLGEPYYCKYHFFYSQNLCYNRNSIYVDISDVSDKKAEAISNYSSQFLYDSDKQKTYLNARMIQKINAKDKYCGALINADYAEEIIANNITINNIFDITF